MATRTVTLVWEDDIPIDDTSAAELSRTAPHRGSVVPMEAMARATHTMPVNEYHRGVDRHSGPLNENIDDLVFDYYEFEAGHGSIAHSHEADKIIMVLSGRARFDLDGEARDAPAGSAVFIPKGTVHGYKFIEDTSLVMIAPIWVQSHVIFPGASDREVIEGTNFDWESLTYRSDPDDREYVESCLSCAAMMGREPAS